MRRSSKGLERLPAPACPAPGAGFTFVELITAMAIIVIVTAIAAAAYSDYHSKALRGRTIAEIHMLETSIAAYTQTGSRLPDKLSEVRNGNALDPWGRPYQYLNIADSDAKGKGTFRKDRFLNPLNSDFDLYSMGPDGKSQLPLSAKDSEDDIIRANNGAFIGAANEY